VPVYCLIFFLSAAAFVAFTSRRNAAHRRSEQVLPIGDEEREWLARHSAWLLIAAIAWAAVTSLVLFGPMLLLESPRLLSALGGISGIIAFVGGRSALTPATAEKGAKPTLVGRLLGRALPIAAFLFIAVLIASLSLGTSALIATIEESALGRFGPEYRPQISRVLRHGQWVGVRGSEAWAAVTREEVWTPLSREGQLAILYQTPARMLFFLALILGVLGYGLSLLINLNQFSLHAAYRARLIRAFLGAATGPAQGDELQARGPREAGQQAPRGFGGDAGAGMDRHPSRRPRRGHPVAPPQPSGSPAAVPVAQAQAVRGPEPPARGGAVVRA
jgi:hypothetical protein